MHKQTITLLYILTLVAHTSCVQTKKVKTTPYQSGIVSHYSTRTNSPSPTTTASGIPLNDSLKTAAHKTLPFNTEVKVIRADNPDLQTVVRITDRGPYIAGRVLDVSQAAAKDLGLIGRGIAKCNIEIIE